MSGHATRLDWVDTAKGISIILVVMMYSVFNVGQDAEGVGLLPLRHRLCDAVPDAGILPDLGAVPRSGAGPHLARLCRPPRRPLSLFLRALGGDPHRAQDRHHERRARRGRAATCSGRSSSPMACCGSSICSPPSASSPSSSMTSRRRAGSCGAFGAAAADGAHPDRQLSRRPVLPPISSISTRAICSRR